MRPSLLAPPLSLLAALLTLIGGCSGDAGHPPAQPAAPAPSGPSPAASASASAAASSGPTPPPAALVSPFSVYGDLGSDEGLIAPMGDKALLVVGRNVMLLDGDRVVADPSLIKGVIDDSPGAADNQMESQRTVLGASGEFPRNAFLWMLRPWGRVAGVDVLRWEKDRWAAVTGSEAETLLAVFDARGTALGAFIPSVVLGVDVRPLSRGGRMPIDLPDNPSPDDCPLRFLPQALVTLPSRAIVAVGSHCSTLRALSWAPESRKAVSSPLPGLKPDEFPNEHARPQIFVLPDGGAELWLPLDPGGDAPKDAPKGKRQTYAARFDGATWKELPAPAELTVDHQLTREGTVWMRTPDGKLLRRTKNGEIEPVVMPKDIAGVASFWARGDGDVWARSGSILLHTRPNPQPGNIPAVAAQTARLKSLRFPSPLARDCSTPFVFLFSPTKMAPAHFDYPLTRKALKGHLEYKEAVFVEWRVGEKRFFGAKVPTAAMAKSLTALITKELKGSAPQAVCHDPEPSRTLKIDLATGAVVE